MVTFPAYVARRFPPYDLGADRLTSASGRVDFAAITARVPPVEVPTRTIRLAPSERTASATTLT